MVIVYSNICSYTYNFAVSDFTQFALNVIKAKHCPVHAEIFSHLVFFCQMH